MEETEFREKYLGEVGRALEFALNNEFSDFYKLKYKKSLKPENIKSYADFRQIPFLVKDEILATPLSERIFVDQNEIEFYAASSGTTKHSLPLVIPRLPDSPEEKREDMIFLKENQIERTMILFPTSIAVVKAKLFKTPYLIGDPNNLSLAAKIAKSASVDGIFTTPTILYLFLEQLIKEEFPHKKIRFISLGAEYCTKQKKQFFNEKFPNAYLSYSFGSSEIGGAVGFRCKYLDKERPNLFHPRNINLLEIENAKGTNDYGEIVCTHLTKRAFPLIRYKTGDLARITQINCECGEKSVVELRGRQNLDNVRIAGALINTEMVANALGNLSDVLSPLFQVLVSEEKTEGNIKVKMIIKVIPIKKIGAEAKIKIAETIEKTLYLSAKHTMHDFVQKGIFKKLKIELVDHLEDTIKTKSIITDLD